MQGLSELLDLGADRRPFVTTGHATDQFSNVAQLVREKGSVAAVNSGPFSEKAILEMRAAGVTVHEVAVPYGEAVDVNELGERVRRLRPDVVYLTASNTAVGTFQLRPGIREAIGPDPLLVVDEVSLMAGYHYDRAAFGVDFGFAGMQKCFRLTPGLAVGYLSSRAEKKAADAPGPGIHNLHRLAETSAAGKPMATDNVNLVRALEHVVYDVLQAGGTAGMNERNRELNRIYDGFVESLEGWDVRSFPKREDASPTVGCYTYPPGRIRIEKVKAELLREGSLVEGYAGVTIDTGYRAINEQLRERGLATGRVPLFGQDPDIVRRILGRQAELMKSLR